MSTASNVVRLVRPAAKPDLREPARVPPLRVLVIEDSPEDRMIIRCALGAEGYALTEAATGEAGLALARTMRPDCILLDYLLPDYDGFEVLERLRQDEGNLACAVVMLTGTGDVQQATALLKVGAMDYLPKHQLIDEDRLQRAVTSAVERFAWLQDKRRNQERNAQLAAIVAASNDAIISVGPDDRVRTWNPGAVAMFGFTEDEAISRPIEDLIVPEHLREERRRLYSDVNAGRVALVLISERRRKDGSLIPVEVTASPMFDPGGQAAGISVIIRDISERKQAEQELQRAAERAEIAQEAARATLYELDPAAGSFIRSHSFAGVLGWSPDEIPTTGEAWRALIHPDDASAAWAAMGSAIEHEPEFSLEYRVRHKAGHYVWVFDRARIYRDAAGRAERIIGLIVDITERKKAEERVLAITGALSAAEHRGEAALLNAPLPETRDVAGRRGSPAERLAAVQAANLLNAPADRSFDQIARIACGVLLAPISIATVIDDQRQYFFGAHGLAEPVATGRQKPIFTSYCRHVIESGAPVIVNDARTNPLVADMGAWRDGFVSYLGVPVRNEKGVTIASLSVSDSKPRAWTRQELLVLQGIAALLVREIENRAIQRELRSAETELRNHIGRQQVLLDLTSGFVDKELSEQALGQRVFESIAQPLEAQFCINYRADPSSRRLELVTSSGMPEERLAAVRRLEFGEASCGAVAETRRAIVADAVRIAAEPSEVLAREMGLSAYACFPLMGRAGALLGTFLIGSRTRDRFSPEEVAFVKTVTNLLARAWERHADEREIRDSEAFSRSILEASPDCTKVVSTTGDLEFINVNGLCIMEIDDFGPLRGRKWSSLWPEAMRERIDAAIAVATAGQTDRFEGYCPTAKETPKWWDVMVVPFERDGRVTRLIATSRDITERRRYEEALRESEGQLRAIYDGGTTYVGWLAPDGTLVRANRASLEFADSGLDDVLGRPFWETVWFQCTAGAPELMRETLARVATGETVRREMTLVRPTGEPRTFDVSLHPVREEGGKLLGIVPEGRDITERKRAEEALRESEQRLMLALHASATGVWDWDLESDRVNWSGHIYPIFGVSAFGGTREDFARFVHPDDASGLWASIEEALRTRAPFEAEFRIVRPDGEVRWVSNHACAEYDAAGRPVRLLGTVSDITERRRAGDMLRASQALLQGVTDRARVGLFLVDEEMRLRFGNPAWLEMLGLPGDTQIIGRGLRDVVGDQQFTTLAPEIARVRSGESVKIEQSGAAADAVAPATECREVYLEPISNGIGGVLGVVVDISERMRREKQIELLMGEVNHRSKNLLSVVQAVARQIARTGDPADYVALLSDRILSLAASHDLLVKSEWTGVDLRALAEAQLAHFKDLFGTRVILDGPPARLGSAAAQGIGMALHELATNAGKYGSLSEPTGTVRLSWAIRPQAGQGAMISLRWVEEGGPSVRPPSRGGFGQLVIGPMAEAAVQGTAEIDYRKSGLVWALEFPAASALERGI